jgi:light-regulated signal transduction histidine kinase (bacteriophytochrome)
MDYPTLSETERKDGLKAVRRMAFKMNDIIDELLLLSQVRQAEVQLQPLDMARSSTKPGNGWRM